MLSEFEPKYNQPSPIPLSIRHRHLAGEELIAHRFTMSLIAVDMSVSSDPHRAAKMPWTLDGLGVI